MSGVYSGDTPQPKDTVRVQFDAEYQGQASGGPVRVIVVKGGHRAAITLPDGATVEVLERADDPSKDPIGTVRRRPDGVVAAKSPNPDYPWRGFGEPCGENFATVSVIGWPVIGSVPGTPAAEAEKPAHGLFQTVSDEHAAAIVSGDWTGTPQFDATVYPEVSGGGVPYPPVHVDNEAIVTGQYYTEKARAEREPRVFRSNLPEPPPDVQVLEWLEYDEDFDGSRYLKRVHGTNLWRGADTPGEALTAGPRVPWPQVRWTQVRSGLYREVLS